VRSGNSGENKSTLYNISDFTQVPDKNGNLAIPCLTTRSRSGAKGRQLREDKEGKTFSVPDTTCFNVETIGDACYFATGHIDIYDKSRFISLDERFGRQAFNSDYFEVFKKAFKENTGEDLIGDLGYYRRKTQSTSLGEYGYAFTDEIIVKMVKYLLKQTFGLSIVTASGRIEVVSIKIKYVVNTINDKFISEDGWISLLSEKDVDDISFKPYSVYELMDEEKAIESNKLLDKFIAEAKIIREEEIKTTSEKKKAEYKASKKLEKAGEI